MGLLNIIRRMHLRQKLSIRKIARRTGLSRNTVAKHLAADTIDLHFATPERPSKLDPFAEKLASWLKTNAGKPRKERQTLKKMHADLVALGFTGSYNRVAAFARQWRADRQREQQTTGRGTFVPLAFRPGEAFQFDWSEDFAVVGGERRKLQVAHIKLSHSRAFLLRAYPLQTHEMLFDAHWHAFRVFGGVPARGVYDIEPWCRHWSEAHGEGAQRWIGSVAARSGRSISASWPWQTTMSSSLTSAIRRLGGTAPVWRHRFEPAGAGASREERPRLASSDAARHAGLSRSCRAE
jgi:transposase